MVDARKCSIRYTFGCLLQNRPWAFCVPKSMGFDVAEDRHPAVSRHARIAICFTWLPCGCEHGGKSTPLQESQHVQKCTATNLTKLLLILHLGQIAHRLVQSAQKPDFPRSFAFLTGLSAVFSAETV